jgi:beta-phosphoglucomutase family hydrolase
VQTGERRSDRLRNGPECIHGFIFDMDGTIVDNMRVHERVWIAFLDELGVRITPEVFHREASGKTTAQILRRFVGDHLSRAEIEALDERKEARYREVYGPDLRPLAGLRRFLEAARREGVPMALATSAGMTNIEFVLGGLGLAPFFDVRVCAGDVSRGKPDPEIYLLTARRLGVEAGRCIVFEDSRAGIEAVRRAGMRAVALATTLEPEAFAGNPAVIRVVRDFTPLEPGPIVAEAFGSRGGATPGGRARSTDRGGAA